MLRMPRGLLAVGLAVAMVAVVGCFRDGGSREPVLPPAIPPDDLKALVDGNNRFAIDLYRKVAGKQPGNVVLSPYSISTALAMTYAGAKGETAAQMAKTLHFTLPPERLHAGFGEVARWLRDEGKRGPHEVSTANALWPQKGMRFVPAFLDITGRHYVAGLREVDFIGDRAAARGEINRWVEEQTRDRIKDLLKPDDLDGQTRLVLTNAIYFRGEWQTQFDPGQTYSGDFEVAPGQKVKTPIMRRQEMKVRTAEVGPWQVLELPYAGDTFAFLALLPKERCGLSQAVPLLSVEQLREMTAKLTEGKIDVYLPKFRLDARTELGRTLADMGMPLAFGAADFSGITPDAGLSIKEVIHGASIEVNEVGTIAAAATHGIMAASAPPEFRADHPFLFAITDQVTNQVFFIGRVGDPR